MKCENVNKFKKGIKKCLRSLTKLTKYLLIPHITCFEVRKNGLLLIYFKRSNSQCHLNSVFSEAFDFFSSGFFKKNCFKEVPYNLSTRKYHLYCRENIILAHLCSTVIVSVAFYQILTTFRIVIATIFFSYS